MDRRNLKSRFTTSRCDTGGNDNGEAPKEVLAICDFSSNLTKVERHVGPLARTAQPTMVCIRPDEHVNGIRYITVPSLGWRPFGLILMLLAAVIEGYRGEYDAVVSFSLVPHGMFALVVGRVYGLPCHLGIIGADLDVHVKARYGSIIEALLSQFDVVSVPGEPHRDRLLDIGVDPDRALILINPIDPNTYRHDAGEEYEYDLLWVGRLSDEKDPELFVEACSHLDNVGVEFRAVMVGDGPLRSTIASRLRENGLEGIVEMTGWIDEPVALYRRSLAFALTSRRDALPLTLLEAMSSGCVPVAPRVGNVEDVAVDDENAILVDDREPTSFATAFESVLHDPQRIVRLSRGATTIRDRYDYETATAQWQKILERLNDNHGMNQPARPLRPVET